MLWRHCSKLGVVVVGVADEADEESSAAPVVTPVGEPDEQPPAKAMVVQQDSNRSVRGLVALMSATLV
jgi:hypothetical protein